EELAHMPIFLRAEARKNGLIQHREIGRTDGSTPLFVPETAQVTVNLEFVAPAVNPPDTDWNKLIIEGTTWQRSEVPLDLIIGLVTATLSPTSATIRQGDSGVIQATITSVAGPDTDVSFWFGQAKTGTITPAVVNLSRGRTVTSNLRLS